MAPWVDAGDLRSAVREILGQAGFHRPIAPVIDHDQVDRQAVFFGDAKARGHGVVVKPGIADERKDRSAGIRVTERV